jgi:hypothetical protein
MDAILIAALALGLGLLIGFGAGVRRTLRLYRAGRLVQSTSEALGRIFGEEFPRRSAVDMLAGRVRVTLGGVRYDLPVLNRRESREWLATLEARLSALVSGVNAAEANPAEIIPLLMTEADAMCDLLKSYDQHDVLPARDELDRASDPEILRAVLEVWQAANPKAATTNIAAPPTSGSSPEPPSSSPTNTAGARASWST